MSNVRINQLFQTETTGDLTLDFHQLYLTKWNSGISNRNYENYIRDIRVGLGLNTFNRSETFISLNKIDTIDQIHDHCAKEGIQIVFSNHTLIWGYKLVSGIPAYCIEVVLEEKRFTFTVEGCSEYVNDQHNKFNKLFSGQNYLHIEKLTISANGELNKTGKFLKKSEDLVAKDVYYPWLSESKESFTLESFSEAFSKSSSNALLLYGERGTGKSTFIRTLLFFMGRKNNIMITDEPTMRSQGFRAWLETADEDSVIILEDADNVIGKREDGNESMVSLLNITNGVIPKKIKIIISTNLGNLNRIDSALLRVGRMFGALEFKPVTADQVNVIRKTEGLSEIQDIPSEGLTLSEILNYEHLHREFKKKNFGFN